MNEIDIRLQSAIEKYKASLYNEHDFQSTLNSIIESITANELYELKEFLRQIDFDLEHINFMVSENQRRTECLKVISKIEDYYHTY